MAKQFLNLLVNSSDPYFNLTNGTTSQFPEEFPLLQSHLLVSVIMIIINLIVIGGNLLVIIVILAYKRLRVHTANIYFILNLSVADILVGILVLPFAISHDSHSEWKYNERFCDAWQCLDVSLCTLSMATLVCISMDKYIYISRPFFYEVHKIRDKYGIILAMAWIISFMYGIIPKVSGWSDLPQSSMDQCLFVKNVEYTIFTLTVGFGLPWTMTLFANVRLLMLVNTQRKGMRQMRLIQKRLNENGMSGQDRYQYEGVMMGVKTVGFVCVTFALMWLPFFIVLVTQTACQAYTGRECLPSTAVIITTHLGYANSGINPFIYAYNKHFRTAYIRLFRFSTRRSANFRQNQSVSQTNGDYTYRQTRSLSCSVTQAGYMSTAPLPGNDLSLVPRRSASVWNKSSNLSN